MRARVLALALAGILMLAAAGCGGGGHARTSAQTTQATNAAGSARTEAAAAATPRMSPAKRRYLTHFQANCTQADKLTSRLKAELNHLLNQIQAGNSKALAQAAALFHRIAAALAVGVSRDRALGRPPDPDSVYAQRYLADVTVTALAFQRIGDGLQGGNLQLISAAEKVISQLDTQVQSDAHRYGIPTCPTQGGGASGGPSVPTV